MTKVSESIDKPSEQKPRASIDLGKKMKCPKLKMGEMVTLTLHGRVNGYHDNEYSRGFDIEIDNLETDTGMAGDMQKMKKSRTMTNEYESGQEDSTENGEE